MVAGVNALGEGDHGDVKPQYCWLCGRDFRCEWYHTRGGGELVRFCDYQPLPEGCIGQPQGSSGFVVNMP